MVATSAATAALPPAASSAPEAAARPIELELEVRADGPAQRPTVFVVAKALGIEERVTEVPAPFVCRLAPSESGGSVTCTPDARKVELAIAKQSDALELTRLGQAAKRTAIPPGMNVVIKRSEKSSRDLASGQCPQGAPSRTYEAPFLNQFDPGGGGKFSLLIPNADKTRAQPIQLFRNPGAMRCRSDGTEGARKVLCDDIGIACDVRVDGASV